MLSYAIQGAHLARAAAILALPILAIPLLGMVATKPARAAEAAKHQLEAAASAASVVGAAIRRRGHMCTGPVAAEAIAETATAHRKQWRLTCGATSYRVTFVLDRMVNVERLD